MNLFQLFAKDMISGLRATVFPERMGLGRQGRRALQFWGPTGRRALRLAVPYAYAPAPSLLSWIGGAAEIVPGPFAAPAFPRAPLS